MSRKLSWSNLYINSVEKNRIYTDASIGINNGTKDGINVSFRSPLI